MTTSPASAEESKNAILDEIRASTTALENTLTDSAHLAAIAIATDLVILLILLFVISLVTFVYIGILSWEKATIAFAIVVVYLIIVGLIFTTYARDYTRKSVRGAGEVFNNYVASEDAVNLVYQTVLTYGNAL